ADARLGAEVRGPEQGEPDGADALRRPDAATPRRARGRRPPRARDRRRDRRQARSARLMQVGRIELPRAGRGRRRVTVVGAGNVGATCALELARRDYADVILVDIIPNYPQGKALDMNQAG